eukprot:gnl/Chilomastix_cuspidata/1318.p1 GENE.gnl/Chilomastix_cuspidata/1318~~gnl/Chilomastix_cuspidata/1318.p1  ORF type:complete len:482 (+),score=96.41 gnl/Chilomastix_cuspidata/1318:145-1446(+)
MKGDYCNDLGNYCGGTFDGIVDQLDYISELGFNAIWISPVITNRPGGYHGYWAEDIWGINSNFGSASDLRVLVDECHNRDIWVMLDVVANHMGNCDSRWDFSCLSPFDSSEHYHSYDCDIENWDDQWEVENCRLSGLPDLDQDNSFVYSTLNEWIAEIVEAFGFDGIRVDTAKDVPKSFWADFLDSAGVFSIGEVFDGDISYVAPYQEYFPSLFNYPLYYSLLNTYGYGGSLWDLSNVIKDEENQFPDVTLLATFTDNHDNARWLYQTGGDWERYRSALTFALFYQGVPVIYYGSEQGFNGGNDPYCRECLWPTGFVGGNELYDLIRTIAHMRRINYGDWLSSRFEERYVLDDLYCFSRGDVFVTTTNAGSQSGTRSWSISNTPFRPGATVCNIFWPDSDCVTIGADGSFGVWLVDGEPKVFVPEDDVWNYLG